MYTTGGKWTTYRLMAEETVDRCIKVCKLKSGKSLTKGLLLEGAHDWTPTMFIRLIQDFGLDHKVLFHYLAGSAIYKSSRHFYSCSSY